MSVQHAVTDVLENVLGLDGRASSMTRDTELLGALPELDSVSVVAVIAALEERFQFAVQPDELDSSSFASVGALSDFVEGKLTGSRWEGS